MIDSDGFRPNVGIILTNDHGQVLWARRVNQDASQFPQGGINPNESTEEALFRELHEEIGLQEQDVDILVRTHSQPLCIGQKQKWFLLRLRSNDEQVRVDLTDKPEFDSWRWVSYWYPLGQVVAFKRDVYRRALKELVYQLPTRD